MSFCVTSSNRGAVRRTLVAAGMPAAEVRTWSLAELGARLQEAVANGRISYDDATAACAGIVRATAAGNSHDGRHDVSNMSNDVSNKGTAGRADGAAAASPQAAAANLAVAITEAVQAALAGMRPGTDEARVRAIVKEVLEEERLRPSVVEIRTSNTVRQIEGRTHAKFPTVLKIASSRVAGRRLHVWLTGPSGSGKSHLAKQVAEALGLTYYCTGAIQTKYDLIGFVSPSGDERTLRTPFREAFEHGGVFAWDDIDASDPRAFVAFNEALSNGRFAFPDRVVEAHPEFVAIASANTWGNGATAEYVGRNKIDAATLTRFVRVEIGYDEELERDLVGDEYREWAVFVQKVRAAVSRLGLKVLITPRHTLQGAALLAAGIERSEVETMTVFAGLDRDTVNKLRDAANAV